MKKLFIGGILGGVLVGAAVITYLFLGPATTDVRGKWVSFGENKLRVSASSLRGDLVQASPFTKNEMVIRSDKNVKINPITHTITEKVGDFSVTHKFRMEKNNEVLKIRTKLGDKEIWETYYWPGTKAYQQKEEALVKERVENVKNSTKINEAWKKHVEVLNNELFAVLDDTTWKGYDMTNALHMKPNAEVTVHLQTEPSKVTEHGHFEAHASLDFQMIGFETGKIYEPVVKGEGFGAYDMLSVGSLSTLFTDNPVKNIDTEKVLNRIPQITWRDIFAKQNEIKFRYGISNTLITQQLVIKKSNIDFSQDKMQINAIRMETYLNDVAGDASSKQDMIADPLERI